ncbi:MAG: VOC family protein [Acidimicrobiales bacterium]|nr:VOC family protein [Acidimicrobiales bacterium]
MACVSTYLNFPGNTEDAFNFYEKIFNSKISTPVVRFKYLPGGPPIAKEEEISIVHIELPIIGGHVIMATDVLTSLGQSVEVGNNTTINLEVDSSNEADKLYAELSEGGSSSTGMQNMPWGYWGCTLDKFGIRWMFNVSNGEMQIG